MVYNYYFYKFSVIKWYFIKGFFESDTTKIHHVSSLEDALKKNLKENATVFFWGKKVDLELHKYAKQNSINVHYIEDGFIRSVGLGSSLSRPLSIVSDSRGIYFDPTHESDLEFLLSNHDFDEKILEESKEMIALVKKLKISKYNSQDDIPVEFTNTPAQKIILIPGQVDDDMSVKYGAPGMSNLSLIQKVKAKRENEYLVYKPHPDVLSGNRIGELDEIEVLKYVDQIVTNVDIDTMINLSDEVHTMTSLVGFDALVRNKKVFTYGIPFYAGWGLTEDEKTSTRRTRKLTLQELAAAVYILYPMYLNPYTNKLSNAKDIANVLKKDKDQFTNNKIFRYSKKSLGYILPKIRNVIKFLLRA